MVEPVGEFVQCDTPTEPHKHKGPIKQGHVVHDDGAAKDVQHWMGFIDDSKDAHTRSDGMIGGDTSRALNDKVRQFQTENNLTANGEINKETLDAMRTSPDEATRKAVTALEKLEKDGTLSRVYNPKAFADEGCGITEDLSKTPLPGTMRVEAKPPAENTITADGKPIAKAEFVPIADPDPKAHPLGFNATDALVAGLDREMARKSGSAGSDKACVVVPGMGKRMDVETWDKLPKEQQMAIIAARDCMTKHTENGREGASHAESDPALAITARGTAVVKGGSLGV